MNSRLQELLEKQGSELIQAKQVIPTLQKQVKGLKADKYSVRLCFEGLVGCLRALTYDQEASNSLEYSSGDPTTPGSPDDMFLKDLNPCLTPCYAKSKSKEFESMSSDYYRSPDLGKFAARAAWRSDESRFTYGKQMAHKLF